MPQEQETCLCSSEMSSDLRIRPERKMLTPKWCSGRHIGKCRLRGRGRVGVSAEGMVRKVSGIGIPFMHHEQGHFVAKEG